MHVGAVKLVFFGLACLLFEGRSCLPVEKGCGAVAILVAIFVEILVAIFSIRDRFGVYTPALSSFDAERHCTVLHYIYIYHMARINISAFFP